jgi:ATP-dependent protease HslVU (ClpYQ) ATPase subunit
MEEVLRDILFTAPERSGVRVDITRPLVSERLEGTETDDLTLD